jgi:hypothetical protein
MLEKRSRIIRPPRRLDEVAFRGDLNPVRNIAGILGQGAEFSEHRAHRTKVLLRLFIDDITIQ